MEVLRRIIIMFCFFPLGFILSILTERLASRNVASRSLPRVWTTMVKCGISYIVWTHLIFLGLTNESDDGYNLTSLSDLISPQSDTIRENNDPMNTLGITLSLILRCLIFCFGAKFGQTLQPVGLTGGIACGKSTVAKLLRHPTKEIKKDAFAIIDVDQIAHDILVPGKMGSDCGYKHVVKKFSGEDIFEKSNAEDPPIDRRKLGNIIFRDARKRRFLNGITHPLIFKVMMKQIIREGLNPSLKNTSIVSVDIPLLFEIGVVNRMLYGIKIVVACDEDIQIKRLMNRNKDLTREQCESRMKSQIPVIKKAKMADIVIWNNGTMDELVLQVESARQEVLNRSHAFMGVTLANIIFAMSVITTSSCLFEIVALKLSK